MPKKVIKNKPSEAPYNFFFFITQSQVKTLKKIAAKNNRSLRKEIVSRVNQFLEATEIPDKPVEILEKLQIQIPYGTVAQIEKLAKQELLSTRRKLAQIVIESLNK